MPSPPQGGCGSPRESAPAAVSATRAQIGAQSKQHSGGSHSLRCEGGTVPSSRPPGCTGAGCAAATLNGAWHSPAALHLHTDEDEFIPAFSTVSELERGRLFATQDSPQGTGQCWMTDRV